jgi:hypothetical protein
MGGSGGVGGSGGSAGGGGGGPSIGILTAGSCILTRSGNSIFPGGAGVGGAGSSSGIAADVFEP